MINRLMKSISYNGRYNFDFPLILTTLLLVAVGVIFIYSAGSYGVVKTFLAPHIKQVIYLLPGIALFAFFLFFNYQKLGNYWLAMYLAATVSLILVLVLPEPYAIKVNNAKSWFSLGGKVSIQPSEFAKILLILVLAKYIDHFSKSIGSISKLVVALAIPMPIIVLVMLQSDPGTATVFIPITLFMLLVGGANLRHIIIVIAIGVFTLILAFYPNHLIHKNDKLLQRDKIENVVKASALFSMLLTKSDHQKLKRVKLSSIQNASVRRNEYYKKIKVIKNRVMYKTLELAGIVLLIAIVIFLIYKIIPIRLSQYLAITFFVIAMSLGSAALGQQFLKTHHTKRIQSFIDLDADPRGSGYNQRQSLIAIGSGGAIGHGLLNGPQNKLNFIPEKTTDFIFAVIGEEWGFFRGSLFVLILYAILIYRGMMIAYNSRDYFGTLIATGITAMFFTHIFTNLAMCAGIWPVMGIPLPFLSSGGSSLLVNLVCVALLINISQRRFVH